MRKKNSIEIYVEVKTIGLTVPIVQVFDKMMDVDVDLDAKFDALYHQFLLDNHQVDPFDIPLVSSSTLHRPATKKKQY